MSRLLATVRAMRRPGKGLRALMTGAIVAAFVRGDARPAADIAAAFGFTAAEIADHLDAALAIAASAIAREAA